MVWVVLEQPQHAVFWERFVACTRELHKQTHVICSNAKRGILGWSTSVHAVTQLGSLLMLNVIDTLHFLSVSGQADAPHPTAWRTQHCN